MLPAGTRLGPYEIIEPIGVGGMGEVHKACDTCLGRIVAIKKSLTPFDDRIEREARAIASLNHYGAANTQLDSDLLPMDGEHRAATALGVRVISADITPPDVERKISWRPLSRHTGELPPSCETFARLAADAPGEPGGVKERMYTSLRPDSFDAYATR